MSYSLHTQKCSFLFKNLKSSLLGKFRHVCYFYIVSVRFVIRTKTNIFELERDHMAYITKHVLPKKQALFCLQNTAN